MVSECSQGNLCALQFSLFPKAEIVHGSFLRTGGVSEGPFASLNFSVTPGDDPEAVRINRLRAQALLGIETLCQLHQCHSTTIVEAQPGCVPQADGIMTDLPQVGLMVLHADCQAALFYDPIHRAIAAVHCGWRGNVGNIYRHTISQMQQRYQTDPKHLKVAISPSLGPSAAEFIHYSQEFPKTFLPFKIGASHFDLWALATWQLTQGGVLEKNIEIARLCTYSDPHRFFSYRRLQRSGRHASCIMLL